MMKSTLVALGLATATQAAILPESRSTNDDIQTDGCRTNFDGRFEISAAPIDNSKRTPSCGTDSDSLVLTLTCGTLKDGRGRTGYIASNHQLQFDAPPQYNALRTSGFSICDDNVLTLGNSKVFYECLADKFYNSYDADVAPQCRPVMITIWPCNGPESTQGGQSEKPQLIWEIADGQIQTPWTESDES